MVGDGIRSALTVTGEAAALSEDESLAQAAADYQRYVQSQTAALLEQTTAFVDAVKAGDIDGRQGAVPGGPHLLGADRAGGRELRRPRPAHRRAARATRSRGRTSPASTASRRRSGRPATSATWGPTPTSCSPTSRRSSRGPNEVDARRRCSWPTAPRRCSTRSPPARSPARRTATRTPTCGTSPANLEGSQGRRPGAAPVPRGARPRPGRRDRRAVRRDRGRARARTAPATAGCSRPARPRPQLQGAQRQHHRPDRVGQQGRGGRRGADDARHDRRADRSSRAASPGAGCSGWSGAGTAGVLAAGATGGVIGARGRPGRRRRRGPGPDDAVPFTGAHQAGIVTPAQDRLHFVAFDVTTDEPRRAGRDAEGLDRGRPPDDRRARTPARSAPSTASSTRRRTTPVRRSGCRPSGLTLTIGFGPTLFTTADGTDRFGLAARRPAPLVELPPFPGDQLDPAISGGDLCIQACANDPQVAVHAVRNLVRLGAGVVSVRWSQLGFGRTSSTSTGQATPRNLFGFKDGTNNLKAENDAAARPVRLGGRRRQRRRLAGRRLLPGHPADPDADRALGHLLARRAGADHRPDQGRRRAAGPARRSSTRSTSPSRPTASPPSRTTSHVFLAHPTERRDGDPAPRLQLRRRLRRARPAGRRAVLHRLPAGPGDRLRAGAAQPARSTR